MIGPYALITAPGRLSWFDLSVVIPIFVDLVGMEKEAEGDFFVRSEPGTVKLKPESAEKYVETRLG